MFILCTIAIHNALGQRGQVLMILQCNQNRRVFFLHPKNNECSPQRPLLSGAASKRVNCGNGLAPEKSETMLNQPFRASEITPSASLRAMNRPLLALKRRIT